MAIKYNIKKITGVIICEGCKKSLEFETLINPSEHDTLDTLKVWLDRATPSLHKWEIRTSLSGWQEVVLCPDCR